MKNYGMNVEIKLKGIYAEKGEPKQTFNNVTEIHYLFPSELGQQVAFESDIHGTGCTRMVSDIVEFEAKVAAKKEKQF